MNIYIFRIYLNNFLLFENSFFHQIKNGWINSGTAWPYQSYPSETFYVYSRGKSVKVEKNQWMSVTTLCSSWLGFDLVHLKPSCDVVHRFQLRKSWSLLWQLSAACCSFSFCTLHFLRFLFFGNRRRTFRKHKVHKALKQFSGLKFSVFILTCSALYARLLRFILYLVQCISFFIYFSFLIYQTY